MESLPVLGLHAQLSTRFVFAASPEFVSLPSSKKPRQDFTSPAEAKQIGFTRMANVHLRNGNIFDNASDLVLLPCSAKGTISKFAEQHVKNYNLERPEPMPLGQIKVHPFTGSGTITKYYAWCASVLNDSSSPEAIESIGRHIGEFTRTNSRARSVEAPILGTGAGGLSPEPAATALATGFRNSAHENATLVIFSPYREIVDALQNKIEADFAKESTQAQAPGTKFTKETPEAGRARIVNYAGIWKGEYSGTNHGSVIFELQQDRDLIRGTSEFNEPKVGKFGYTVNGRAAPAGSLEDSFDLTPVSNPSGLTLGEIRVEVRVQEDDLLVGRWRTTIGRSGTFTARRDSSDTAASTPLKPQGSFRNETIVSELDEENKPLSRASLKRMLHIHERLASGSYPNATTLAGELGVSTKSVQRDLDFMRERLNLPLEYESSRFGYHYTELVSTFPTQKFTQEIIEAVPYSKEGGSAQGGGNGGESERASEIWLCAEPRDKRERGCIEEMQQAFLNQRFAIRILSEGELGDLAATLSQPNKEHIYPVIVFDAQRLSVPVSQLRGLIEKRRVFIVVIGNEQAVAQFYLKHSVPTSFRCSAWSLLGAFAEAIARYIRNPSIDIAGVAEETRTEQARVVAPSFNPATTLSNQLPTITNDGVEGTPHIDISADVDSIARVICMKQVTPALSIALFGNWGSGKSFFMRQVREKVRKIKEAKA